MANITARSGCWPRWATGCAFPPGNSSARCSLKFRSAVCGANSRTTSVSWAWKSYARAWLTPAGESHERERTHPMPSQKTHALLFMNLAVTHTTAYGYATPVSLRPHVFRLRPRCDGALRLLHCKLEVEPKPTALAACLDAAGEP